MVLRIVSGRGRAQTAVRHGVTAAALVLLASCSSGFDHPAHEVTARTASDGIQHVDITAHTYWYEPNRVVVTHGVPVVLTIHNAAALVPHGFTCIAPAAGLETRKIVGLVGRTKVLRFTPEEPGEYPFFCQVWGHAKRGMTGTLVVK